MPQVRANERRRFFVLDYMLLLMIVIAGIISMFVGQAKKEVEQAGEHSLDHWQISKIPNVYDDGESAYIKVGSPTRGKEDEEIAELMTKKKAWQQLFSQKRIVSITYVTANSSVGLLIHYENRE